MINWKKVFREINFALWFPYHFLQAKVEWTNLLSIESYICLYTKWCKIWSLNCGEKIYLFFESLITISLYVKWVYFSPLQSLNIFNNLSSLFWSKMYTSYFFFLDFLAFSYASKIFHHVNIVIGNVLKKKGNLWYLFPALKDTPTRG